MPTTEAKGSQLPRESAAGTITGVSATMRLSPADSMLPGRTGMTNWRMATTRLSGSPLFRLSQTTAMESLRKATRGFLASRVSAAGSSFSLTWKVLPRGLPVASKTRAMTILALPPVPEASSNTTATRPSESMPTSQRPGASSSRSSATDRLQRRVPLALSTLSQTWLLPSASLPMATEA